MKCIELEIGDLMAEYKNNTYFVDTKKFRQELTEETCKIKLDEIFGNLVLKELNLKDKYIEFKSDFDFTFEGCYFEGDVIIKNSGNGRININNSSLKGVNSEYALIVSSQGDVFIKNVCQEVIDGPIKIESSNTVYIGDSNFISTTEVKAKTLQVLNTSAPIKHDCERFFSDQKVI